MKGWGALLLFGHHLVVGHRAVVHFAVVHHLVGAVFHLGSTVLHGVAGGIDAVLYGVAGGSRAVGHRVAGGVYGIGSVIAHGISCFTSGILGFFRTCRKTENGNGCHAGNCKFTHSNSTFGCFIQGI